MSEQTQQFLLNYDYIDTYQWKPQAGFNQRRNSFIVAQLVENGASNAKIMGSIPRESKSW